jgi:hypothetical protein
MAAAKRRVSEGPDPTEQATEVAFLMRESPALSESRPAAMGTNGQELTADTLDSLLRSLDALEEGLKGALKEVQAIRDVARQPNREAE